MKVINLFGAPGSGKSTALYGLTHQLKIMGLNVEKSDEFFKELIAEKSESAFFGGQLYILGEQNRRLARWSSEDFVITDCPLPMVLYYTGENYIEGFTQMGLNLFNKYDNVNIFIERCHEFEKQKRVHDEQQAQIVNDELKVFLNNHNIPFFTMNSSENLHLLMIDYLIKENHITQEQLRQARNPRVRAEAGHTKKDE